MPSSFFCERRGWKIRINILQIFTSLYFKPVQGFSPILLLYVFITAHYIEKHSQMTLACILRSNPSCKDVIRNPDAASCSLISRVKQKRRFLSASQRELVLSLILKKALAEITFLIRIKEEVSLLEAECQAFAVSGDDAICAESSEQLILEPSVTRFTDFRCRRLIVNFRSSVRLKTIW